MNKLRKKIYAAAGYNTMYLGPGRNEFDPSKPMRPFEEYLQETAKGTLAQLKNAAIDEGIIGSFMSGRFIKQANLPGFLPFMVPELKGKPCTAVEGACGTGGRAIAMAARSVLSEISDVVFVAGFEMQNVMKSVYGADVLAGAGYYSKERKSGQASFFPGVFAKRAGAYFDKYGEAISRPGMAKWYAQSIENARKNPKAQEYQNTTTDLIALAMTKPDPDKFIPHLNLYDCSKVSDGASSLIIASAEGLKKCGIDINDAVELIGLGEAEDDITKEPADLTILSTNATAVSKALDQAGITKEDVGIIELHDCFTITALLALESLGYAKKGQAADYILEGNTSPTGAHPVNLSGGLGGFGHPTGATGVRQLVDLLHQFTGKAANPSALKRPFGMMVSMGGDDKTVTAVVVKEVKS
ncbi:MAG TPA: 3-ketoacyl-CoA thiolase [Parachlamydiaceae bacterium]|nr:3-ketoacyl-CoA thiolase [Parachlamydiaceae bacterium]